MVYWAKGRRKMLPRKQIVSDFKIANKLNLPLRSNIIMLMSRLRERFNQAEAKFISPAFATS